MKKINFDDGWECSELSGFELLFNPHAWQPVSIPHDAMISKPRAAANPSGAGGGYFPGGVVSYRKKFTVPEEWRGQTIQLEFEGVFMNAEVTIKGPIISKIIARQPYGYSSFVVDLTPHLAYGEEITLGVTANNSAQPNSRWYTGTGIYRHVWLRAGGSLRIEPWGVFVATPVVDPQASVVQVDTRLAGLTGLEGAVLRSAALDPQGKLVAQVETPAKTAAIQQTLMINGAHLWSLDQPNLYTLLSEVIVSGEVVDSERTVFGIRSIAVDAENGFRLNGVPLKMKGGCVHHDHGPLGAASFDRAEERKVEMLKSAGYNALRTSHNPPSPALLDACDRLGMLVICETFDAWTSPKVANDYHLYFEDWWQRDTAAMILRDRNHPSVVMWSIGNEIFEAFGDPQGAEWSKRQADFVRSLDSTRFVTAGLMINFIEDIVSGQGGSFGLKPVAADPAQDRWGLQTAAFAQPLDVVGYNYMSHRYAIDGARFPGRVIAGTETWGHKMFTYWKATVENPHVIGDFVWTAIDYIGEAGGGRISYDGKARFGATYPYHLYGCGDFDICGFKKPQSYYRDLLWGMRRDPFIAVLDPQHFGKPIAFAPWGWEPVLDTWTFPGQEGKPTQVDVYSIDDEVELFVNGVSAGRQPAGAAAQNKATFTVTYQPGALEAVGYTAGVATGRFQLTTAAAPAFLNLTVDRAALKSGGDIAYVSIELEDVNGVPYRWGDPLVSVQVSGAGELLAIGSGDPESEEPYVGNQRKAFQGRLLAVIRTSAQTGRIQVSAQADNLPTASLELQVG